MGVSMAWFRKQEPAPPPSPVFVDGERASVLVTGLGYKLNDLPRAFGEMSKLTDHDFVAVLKPMPPNEWNRTPIEVWVNAVHIGYIEDHASPRYWKSLRQLGTQVACGCVVKTTAMPVAGQGYQVGRVRLSLPKRLADQA